LRLRTNLLAGAAVVVPLVVTFLVLRFLFHSLDAILQPIVPYVLGRAIPGLGLLALVILVYVSGILARNFVGRWVSGGLDRLIGRVPLAGLIYGATRSLVESFGASGKTAFRRAVILEYPRPGLRTIGFVTGEVESKSEGRRFLSVFVPTPPNPTSGVLVLVAEEDVVDLAVPMEEAVKMVFSGGVAAPSGALW
jgi:uncharacterized membrane protein